MTGLWFLGSSARSGKRKRVVPLWRSRRLAVLIALAVVVATASSATWAWKAGMIARVGEASRQAVLDATAALGFRIREVFVVGRSQTPRAQLLAALGPGRGAPIFGLDLSAARQRILALSWVREASVERVLPDTVVIRIVERKPIALWQRQRTFSLIDEEGEVIADADVGAFNHLLIVVGDEAPAHAFELKRMLAEETTIGPLVKAAVWVGRRRWDLSLKGDIDVLLPQHDPPGALRRLAMYQRSHQLLEKRVRSVDLRLNDRLVIRRAPKAQEDDLPAKGGNA